MRSIASSRSERLPPTGLVVLWLAAGLLSCEGSSTDPQSGVISGNAFSPNLVLYTAATELSSSAQPVRVVALPGAVKPAGQQLRLTNATSGAVSGPVEPRPDGSFVLGLSASAGDRLVVSYGDTTGSQLELILDDRLADTPRPRVGTTAGVASTLVDATGGRPSVALSGLGPSPSYVVYNESTGEALSGASEDTVSLDGARGERICVFGTSADGRSGPALCEQLSPTTCEVACGDVDDDDAITDADAEQIQQFVVAIISLSRCARNLADVNADGQINTLDARLVERVANAELSPEALRCK